MAEAVMEVRGSSIHMTRHYSGKFLLAPIYEIKGDLIYMTEFHPDPYTASEVMEIRHPASETQVPAAMSSGPVAELA